MKHNLAMMITVLAVFLTAGCSEREEMQHEPSGKTVKVGVIAPLSGDDKAWGENGLLGAKTALQLDPYLVNGDKVEFVLEDDRNSPEFTVEAARKLAADTEVAALLVFSGSAAVLELAEITDTLSVPILAVTSTHPGVTENKWISQLVFDDEIQGLVSALYVMDELLVDRVTVFRDLKDPHSVYLAEQFTKKFTESGGTVESVIFAGEGNDFEGLPRRLELSQPSFLYLPLGPEKVMAVEAAARKLDKKPQIMVSDGVLSLIILNFKQDRKLLNGMLAVDVYSTTRSRTNYGEKATATFKKSFKEPGTTITALGCEGTSLLLEAMDKCADSTNRECVNNKLRGNYPFEGFFGKIRIKQNGKIERPVFINLVRNGAMEKLVKIY